MSNTPTTRTAEPMTHTADIRVAVQSLTEKGARFGPGPVVLMHRTFHPNKWEAERSIQRDYRDAVRLFMDCSDEWVSTVRVHVAEVGDELCMDKTEPNEES